MDTQKKLGIAIEAALLMALVGGGGYFVSMSCVLTLFLSLTVVVWLWKRKSIQIEWSINSISILVFVLFYAVTVLWAIDSGMAFEGFLKFLPVFFFFLLAGQLGEKKEDIVNHIPMYGTIMTIFSFVMMQFEVFEPYVAVAGRLAGFFQYPNTYAIFLLAGIVILIYRIDLKKIDWLDIIYLVVQVFGIYMSGSRTVFIIMALLVVGLAFSKKEVRRILLPVVGIGVIVAVVFLLIGESTTAFSRFTTISLKSSTFLGRLLYAKDAIPAILKHPFGLGYYGYYFIQQEIQTGVYSNVNVHNEWLQVMLDIGIIPAIIFFACIVKSIISSKNSKRNRVILAVIMIHCLLDYDLQFLSIMFLVVLCLEEGEQKEYRASAISKFTMTAILVVLCGVSSVIGMSDFYYMRGENQKSLDCYSGNTMAKVALLGVVENAEDMDKLADSIIEENQHISIAYSAKARAAFSNGDVENYIRYKLKAIELAPYEFEEYLDYIYCLSVGAKEYIDTGERASAEVCYKRMEEVLEMLEELDAKTSAIAWEIDDTPSVRLPVKYNEMIEQIYGELYEEE